MKSEVFNVDCMEFVRTLPDGAFDLCIADPPYGIGMDWKKRSHSGGRYLDTSYKNEPITPKFFDEIKRVCKHWIIWGWNYYTEILGSTNYLIVWDKLSSMNPVFKYSKAEIACTDLRIPCNIVHLEWDGYRMGAERGKKKIHPHQKPIALYEWLLQEYAKVGWSIFDPTMGSQSSRIAAYRLGFRYTGCEIDKTYYELGCKRFENLTSQLSLDL